MKRRQASGDEKALQGGPPGNQDIERSDNQRFGDRHHFTTRDEGIERQPSGFHSRLGVEWKFERMPIVCEGRPSCFWPGRRRSQRETAEEGPSVAEVAEHFQVNRPGRRRRNVAFRPSAQHIIGRGDRRIVERGQRERGVQRGSELTVRDLQPRFAGRPCDLGRLRSDFGDRAKVHRDGLICLAPAGRQQCEC